MTAQGTFGSVSSAADEPGSFLIRPWCLTAKTLRFDEITRRSGKTPECRVA
jgi:hypothetical protein